MSVEKKKRDLSAVKSDLEKRNSALIRPAPRKHDITCAPTISHQKTLPLLNEADDGKVDEPNVACCDSASAAGSILHQSK